MAHDLRGRVAERRNGAGGGETPRQETAQDRDQRQRDVARPLVDTLHSMRDEYAKALPTGADLDRLIRDAVTAVKTVPKLAECDSTSVLGAVMTAAQLGLRVGVLGHCWVLPYWHQRDQRRRAQFILGYQGLIELAYRSDRVTMLTARTVHERDEFDLSYGGPADTFRHRPHLGQDGRGAPRLYYALARTTNGGYTVTDPWTEADMVAYRDRFATTRGEGGSIYGPWIDHPIPMRHKTMVKIVGRFLPKSPELAHALAADESLRVDLSPKVQPGEASERIEPRPDDIPGEATVHTADEGPVAS